jgi:hypothetical protein
MRSIGGYAVAAVVLAVLGGAAVAAGRIEHRLAVAEEALASLDFAAAARAYEGLDEYMAYARFVPWLSADLRRVQAQRAAVQYWEGDYDALARLGDPETADAETLFIAANAVYRLGRARGADRAALTRALDQAIGAYRDVLTRDGARSDAAFNYEYLVMQRNELAKGRRGPSPAGSGEEQPAPAHTLHGREGGPPPDQPEDNQKIFVPADPDDATEQELTPGGDQIRERKG